MPPPNTPDNETTDFYTANILRELARQNSLIESIRDSMQTINLSTQRLADSVSQVWPRVNSLNDAVFGNGDVTKSLLVRVTKLEEAVKAANESRGRLVDKLFYPLLVGGLMLIISFGFAWLTGHLSFH